MVAERAVTSDSQGTTAPAETTSEVFAGLRAHLADKSEISTEVSAGLHEHSAEGAASLSVEQPEPLGLDSSLADTVLEVDSATIILADEDLRRELETVRMRLGSESQSLRIAVADRSQLRSELDQGLADRSQLENKLADTIAAFEKHEMAAEESMENSLAEFAEKTSKDQALWENKLADTIENFERFNAEECTLFQNAEMAFADDRSDLQNKLAEAVAAMEKQKNWTHEEQSSWATCAQPSMSPADWDKTRNDMLNTRTLEYEKMSEEAFEMVGHFKNATADNEKLKPLNAALILEVSTLRSELAMAQSLHSSPASSGAASECEVQESNNLKKLNLKLEHEMAEIHTELMGYTAKYDPKSYFVKCLRTEMANEQITHLEELEMVDVFNKQNLMESNEAAKEELKDDGKVQHAAYMRYWRGVRNPQRCSKELSAKIRSGQNMFDVFMEMDEDWKSVEMVVNKFDEEAEKEYSLEDYKTKDQLLDFYKNAALVEAICESKKAKGGKWCIEHPEAPDLESARLYLVWAGSGTEASHTHGKRSDLRGTKDFDVNDEATTEMASAAFRSRLTSAAVKGSLTDNELRTEIEEAAMAKASAKLASDRQCELAVAQAAREQRKMALEGKKTPEDKKRADLMKLMNVVVGKIRQLNAVDISIKELKKETEEEKSVAELAQKQSHSLARRFDSIKIDLDALIALGKRSTLELLETKLDENQKRFPPTRPLK